MKFQERRPRAAWIPTLAGVLWLWWTARAGGLPFLLALPAGGVLLAAGAGCLLWPGDRRMAQTVGLASVLCAVLALPFGLAVGPGPALVLVAVSLASFLVAGRLAVHQEPWTEDVPPPEPSLALDAKVAIDEAVLGLEQLQISLPAGSEAQRLVRELHDADALYAERGWIDDPASFLPEPPPPEAPTLRAREWRGLRYEVLQYESGYEPHPEEPGRDRWLGFAPLRTAGAMVLRHADDRPRGWLIAINGFRMGFPRTDLPLFRRYHEQGLNVLVPVLPLHGARRVGRQSGDRFLAGEVLDTIHGEAQAMWDIRRALHWIRAEGATQVGVYGLSLGGYTAALLAGLTDGLACAIPGIPVCDFAEIFWRHGPQLQLRHLEHLGVTRGDVSRAFRVVSPLALPCRVPFEGRLLFGGVADRLVPPRHVRDLWRHWEEPRIVWFQGAHCTFWRAPEVQPAIDATLRGAKLFD